MSAETAPIPTNNDASGDDALTFDRMPLSSEVRASLAEMGYEKPTPVQAAVFEVAAAGRDAIVQARTGTGKTTAFGLPLVERLVAKEGAAQALVICPTRELALQVSREVDRLGKHRGITTVAVYGGAAMGKQVDQIRAGAQIVVGTPGRLLDHMRRRTLDPKRIKTLVLDESDEMLSMGFERELNAIIEQLPEDRQTLLFSATLPPDTERMARNKLHDPELVILSGDQVGALEILHFVYMVTADKIGAMKQILETEDPESAVLFCNTKEMTERLAGALQREGYECDWLNGDLPQNDREEVMRKTREGKLRFLVATDVAARGIDISHLTHVINFDFPQDAEAYVHRTGRTGRAGRTGTALSLITPQDIGGLYMLRLTYKIRPIERQLPTALEHRTRLEADIVTSLATTFAPRGRSPEHRALARRLLTHDDAEAILAGILHEHLATSPELPELAQSRRRAKNPEPTEDGAPAVEGRRDKRGRRERHDERPRAERRPERGDGERRRPRRGDRDRQREAAPAAGDEEPEPATPPVTAAAEPADVPARAPRSEAPEREPRADRPERAARPEREPRADRPEREASPEREPRVDRPEPRAGGLADVAESHGRRRSEPDPVEPGADEAEDSSPGRPGEIELHVDAGRRDGVRVQALKSILVDGGVALDDVRRVRVRERYSFVEVALEARDAALEALNGAPLGDRVLAATISQRSRGRRSSPQVLTEDRSPE